MIDKSLSASPSDMRKYREWHRHIKDTHNAIQAFYQYQNERKNWEFKEIHFGIGYNDEYRARTIQNLWKYNAAARVRAYYATK